MKCPCCGQEMVMDGHRKIDLYMCYECGYIEGRRMEPVRRKASNFERLKKMNMNEAVSLIAHGLGVDEAKLASWMERPAV